MKRPARRTFTLTRRSTKHPHRRVPLNAPRTPISHNQFLAAFAAYQRAVEDAGGFVNDVKTDERGLLTWSAGTTNGNAGVRVLEELYSLHFRDVELAYLRQLRSSTPDRSADEDRPT